MNEFIALSCFSVNAKKQITMPRGSAWTQQEDETLCRAWLAASEDPITGTGQKKDTFWSSILRNFNSLLPADLSPTDRSISSMQSRWAQINKDVTKFNALYSQVTSILRSGWASEMYLDEALKLFKEESDKKEDFKFLGCWFVLKEAVKWKVNSGYIRDPALNKKKSETLEEQLDRPEKALQRPTGNKLAKDARGIELKHLEVEMRSAAAMESRARVHEDSLTFKILCRIPESEEAQEWFKLKAQEALKMLKEEQKRKEGAGVSGSSKHKKCRTVESPAVDLTDEFVTPHSSAEKDIAAPAVNEGGVFDISD